MQVTIVKEEVIIGQLKDSEVKDICLQLFDKMFEVREDYYLKEERIVRDIEIRGHTSYTETLDVREASGLDIQAVRIRNLFDIRLQQWILDKG